MATHTTALYVIGGVVLTLISALLKRADDKVCAWVNETAGDDE